ncbi:p-hydroxybenzoate 3-monooxygenase [Amycolatopsis pretoriensis]|uniref:p-hydroxybenzoate 3-monooxygenase n=1 Tax=Amycolatopsis pretoriensis TaxID=218821 RepID=A0A1H5RKM3_9PSEU|nr:4-hydroxybenzoate 3-monooxygenase [Amycolatopsis pretoriensis]SEF38057.1 p-hydroxybenzoate 3-monooxygenase [Amycolatopsis pretoriensis]
MIDETSVLIVGAGPAGLVLGNVLQANGIRTLILEQHTRARVQARAKAGFLGPRTVRVLTRHGLATGLLNKGRAHGVCAFRDARGEFALDYGKLGHGEVHTIYPQQDLVTDLIAEYLGRGGEVKFGVTVTEVDAEAATVRFSHAAGSGEARGRFLAGCDGSNGVTREALAGPRHLCDHGIGWLAILAEAPQSMQAVTYAIHDNGFAGHMARSPQVTRYYLQVPPGEKTAAWTDDRIWAELAVRMRTAQFGKLRQGPISERRVVRLRSEVAHSLQGGRMFLAGDAASVISPSAAKGANLAIFEAAVLADAFCSALSLDDETGLSGYSATCLPRIWRAQEFSHWMIGLLHGPAGPEPYTGFHRGLRRSRLDTLRDGRTHQVLFAENYVGI